MRPGRPSVDAVAGALLVAASCVLLATPYDGGSCRNVVAAYGVRPASVDHSEPPVEPPALAEARSRVADAQAASDSLDNLRARAAQTGKAATAARSAADAAAMDRLDVSYSPYDSSVSSAALDVDFAESSVGGAETYLDHVREYSQDTGYGSIYSDADVARAQEDFDRAKAELSRARAALREAEASEAASESVATAAERRIKELEATADAAENEADAAATALTQAESRAQDRLEVARTQLSSLEAKRDNALDAWAHERRVEETKVAAVNAVQDSCRENGAWRAGVAAIDVLIVLLLAARAVRPRLSRLTLRVRR